MKRLLVGSLGLSALLSLASSPGSADHNRIRLSCQDFLHNADGSWSTKRPLRLGSVFLGGGVSFGRRVLVNGVDLAATLDRQCL